MLKSSIFLKNVLKNEKKMDTSWEKTECPQEPNHALKLNMYVGGAVALNIIYIKGLNPSVKSG